jgi:glycosyltransferase involved in cell wall biosynthesis
MAVRRVLHLVNRWERGGVERHLRDLVTGMASHGVDGHIAGWLPAVVEPPKGFTRLALYDDTGSLRSFTGMLRAVETIHDLVDREHIDLMHVHSRLLLPLAAAVTRRTGVPRVLTLHNTFTTLPWLPWQPQHVIALSVVSRDMYLSQRGDATNHTVHVVHNGIALPDDDALNTADSAMGRIAFIGRFTESKGGDVLLDAAAQLHAHGRPVQLNFAGDGPLRTDWQFRAERLGLTTACIWPGMVDDIPSLLRDVDIVVMPSTGLEGSPYVALEALGAGCLLVCSDLPVLKELYGDCPAVFFHRTGDAVDLARTLEAVRSLDTATVRKHRSAARTFIAARASLEAMVRATMNVYERAAY